MTATDLARLCETARKNGADFPTIWREILKPNDLVVASPIQRIGENGPFLEIILRTGQRIIHSALGFSIE